MRRACCLLPRRPARRARAARGATCPVWSRGRYSAVSCQRPAASLERRAAQLVTNAPATGRRPRAHHRQAMGSQQPNGGRFGRLAVGELPLRKNNYRCQKQKSSQQDPCPKAIAPHRLRQRQLGLQTVAATVNLGGWLILDFRFRDFDWRSPSLIFLSGNLSVVYLWFYLLTGLAWITVERSARTRDRTAFGSPAIRRYAFAVPNDPLPREKTRRPLPSLLLFYLLAGLACCTVIPLVLSRGWLGMDLQRALARIVPVVLPRRWLGTGPFRLLTAARRTPAGCFAARTKELLKDQAAR